MTKSGSFCVYGQASQCDPSYQQSSVPCEQTSFCKPACCVDSIQGSCYANVGVAQCSNKPGTSADVSNPSCSGKSQCQQGCCQVGNQCFLSTKGQCTNYAAPYEGLDQDNIWTSSITDEFDCVDQCAQQEQGCCVDASAGCLWTTKGQCSASGEVGDTTEGFYAGTYCSDKGLACGCTQHFRKGCVEDQDDVYWFDSCGNPEEVADDCDYASGTLCQEQGNSASCASVDCVSTVAVPNNPHDPRLGGPRKNGESWCTYDSGTGGFYDRPGSRHYRHVCVNGEEHVEECKDYREEICVQADTSISGTPFSAAQCKKLDDFPKIDLEKFQETNDAAQSTVQPGTAEFSDQSTTFISSTTVDKGDQFWQGDNELACKKGKTECTVVWAKEGFWDDWDCEGNCQCEKPAFIEEANDYCRMFGDCGADINILDKGNDDGLSVSWTGTGKGPHPTSPSPSALEKLKTYGLFSAMSLLKEHADAAVNSHLSEMLGTGVKIASLVQILYLIYTAVPIVAAGGVSALGVGFISGFMQNVFGGLITSGPLGWIIAVVLFVLFIVFGDALGEILGSLLGADTAEKTVMVECRPWIAPYGGEDCEKCDDDVRYDKDVYENPVVCSEYRCKSLGTGCEIVNEGTGNEACVSHNPNDVSPPVITPWSEALPDGYSVAPTGTGYLIQPFVGYWTPFTFGIMTDEVAQCKWDAVHKDTFYDMQHFFGTSLFGNALNMSMSLPGGHDYTYYVRCIDVNGNANVQEYTIQFSTTPEPDLTPPVIEETSIANGAYLATGTTKVSLWLQLNEPVESCGWNKGQDLDFNLMDEQHSFLCGNGAEEEDFENPLDPSSWSFSCVGLLDGLASGIGQQNTYYFRCKDLAGNIMQQGYPFVLKGSSPLKIASVTPSGTLYTNDVMLQVMTQEGAESGKAVCSYKDHDFGSYVDFFTTGSSQHTQSLEDLSLGMHTYDIFCEDVAGNSDVSTISFSVDVDMGAPVITQIYTSGDTLYLHTNEPSTCSYSVDNPDFAFDQGTLFGVDTIVHTLVGTHHTYYIQCKDKYDNLLSGVTVYA
jgi:hypothetical protein